MYELILAGGGTWTEIKKELNRLRSKTEKTYLFTFDTNLSSNLFTEFQQANVQVVTTKSIKSKCYANNEETITLEELLVLCKAKKINFWQNYEFSKKEKQQVRSLFRKKLNNFAEFPLLKDWYQQQIDELEEYTPISEFVDKNMSNI